MVPYYLNVPLKAIETQESNCFMFCHIRNNIVIDIFPPKNILLNIKIPRDSHYWLHVTSKAKVCSKFASFENMLD